MFLPAVLSVYYGQPLAEEVLVQQFTQVELSLVLAPATELLHELRVDVREGLGLSLE